MRNVRTILAGILLLTVAGAFTYYIMPFQPIGRPTLVASGALECGDVLVTQTFTATTDPYVVSLYFRAAGANSWSEYYVDDESLFWRGALRVDADREACGLTYYGAEYARFSCRDRLLVKRGKALGAKASVEDPLSHRLEKSRAPMDVGAQSNELHAH